MSEPLTPADKRLIVALYDERLKIMRQIAEEQEKHNMKIRNLRAQAAQTTLKRIGEKFDVTTSAVLNIVRYHRDA